jgi:hypothetical protein
MLVGARSTLYNGESVYLMSVVMMCSSNDVMGIFSQRVDAATVAVAVAVVVAAAANSNIVVDGSTGYCTHHSKRPKAEHQGLVLKHLIWAMRMEACCTWFSSFSACEDLAKL